MAIGAKAFDDLAVDAHRLGTSPKGRLKRVDHICAEGVSRERQRCPNRVFVEPRMRLKYLFDRLTGGQFLQNQLDGDVRACDHRLAHHHAGIGNNHRSVVAHPPLLPLDQQEVSLPYRKRRDIKKVL